MIILLSVKFRYSLGAPACPFLFLASRVISLLFSLVIVVLLLTHYVRFVRGKKDHNPTDNQKRVRVAGRHFMLQNTLFVLTVGLLALFMSKVVCKSPCSIHFRVNNDDRNIIQERWTYLQGIYFSIVSVLTVGFGDFYPTKPVTQIVVFPFVLIGIVQIASIIELLVRFFRGRLNDRHAERRRAFEKRRQEKEEEIEDEPSFERELLFLKNLYEETNKAQMTQDVITNSLGFLLFWIRLDQVGFCCSGRVSASIFRQRTKRRSSQELI